MGTMVRLRKDAFPGRDRVLLPIGNEYVEFRRSDGTTVCLDEHDAERSRFVEPIGVDCDSKPKPAKSTARSSGCNECGKTSAKVDARMRCSLVIIGNSKRCVRCRRTFGLRTSFAHCTVKGLGDRIQEVTHFLGFKSCPNCDRRRRWLNELDRKIHGWLHVR